MLASGALPKAATNDEDDENELNSLTINKLYHDHHSALHYDTTPTLWQISILIQTKQHLHIQFQ